MDVSFSGILSYIEVRMGLFCYLLIAAVSTNLQHVVLLMQITNNPTKRSLASRFNLLHRRIEEEILFLTELLSFMIMIVYIAHLSRKSKKCLLVT